MDDQRETKQTEETEQIITWEMFLQEKPPNSLNTVTGAIKKSENSFILASPDLQLYCPEDPCKQYQYFSSKDYAYLKKDDWVKTYLEYKCCNCRKYFKVFSVAVMMRTIYAAEVFKFGELPPFGPPVPSRALRLIEPDLEIFRKGQRCENQGLGIGAFTYYRRVVEDQWERLVDEIIKVAKTLDAKPETICNLEAVRNQQQFSKAVKEVKDAIPPALLIKSQNPLTLLHGALSLGVRDLKDEECLKFATHIRIVLVELADNIGQALKDKREIHEAVSQLLQVQSSKKKEEGS